MAQSSILRMTLSSFGMTRQLKSAYGTRLYSDWPPRHPPMSANPYAPPICAAVQQHTAQPLISNSRDPATNPIGQLSLAWCRREADLQRVDVVGDAEVGLALLAVHTRAARDVERDGHEVAEVQAVHAHASLHHFACLLVTEHEAGGNVRAAAIPGRHEAGNT